MKKIIVLTSLFIFTLVLASAYFYLTAMINAGNQKILAGKKQIAQGEEMLARGKQKLASGQGRLSGAEHGYSEFKKGSYALMAAVPVAGLATVLAGDKLVGSKIAAGRQQVARGQQKIKAGEEQLAAGKLQLSSGIQRLDTANKIRIACGIGALLFAAILIFFLIYWRKPLMKGKF